MNQRAAPHRGIDVHYGDAEGDENAPPSKTRLKQASHELQALGLALADLAEDKLAQIDMPDALRDAIAVWRKTKSHEGRRRQMQYIGKLMRSADEDALREALARTQIGSAQETLALHEAERWRDALIADDEALTRWAAEHPETDLQGLRALIRQARKDAPAPDARAESEGRAPRQGRAYRELFKALRAQLSDRAAGDEAA